MLKMIELSLENTKARTEYLDSVNNNAILN